MGVWEMTPTRPHSRTPARPHAHTPTLTHSQHCLDDPPIAALGCQQRGYCHLLLYHVRVFLAAWTEADGGHGRAPGAVGRIGAEAIRAELRREAGRAQASQGFLHERMALVQEPRRQELRPGQEGARVGAVLALGDGRSQDSTETLDRKSVV